MHRFLFLCLAAALVATGCSGSNNGNNGDNNGTNNTVADTDMGGGDDTGSPEPDMGEEPDMRREPPTCMAFPTVLEYVYADETGAFYVADSSEGTPYDELSIELYDEPPTAGTFTLGENYETCTHCVLIFAGCTDTDCSRVFLATSGTLEVTEVGGDGTRFTGSLTNVQFEEVTIDETSYVSTPVPGGELRCVDSHPFDVFNGNYCEAVGDACEPGRPVEDPTFECVDDGTGTGLGTCERPVVCTDGPSGGDANACENTVTCDGVDYKIDCMGTNCSCSVDGAAGLQITADACDYEALRRCGAPIPAVNPTCTDADIADGGGADFCEALVTCNDVTYTFRCDNGAACTCTVDGMPGPVPTAVDCLTPGAALRECGAPLQ